MGARHAPAIERFYRYVLPVTESGCHLWIGSVDHLGYGHFTVQTKIGALSHRFIYEHLNGPIPAQLEIDHICTVRCCVNPDHLRAVTHKVNVHRGSAPTAENARKTHCHNGHPFDRTNTLLHRDGKERVCRQCAITRNREYRRRLKHEC